MKYLIILALLSITAFMCFSNPEDYSHRPYKYGDDGLVYDYETDELFNGHITDTADVIVEFEVENGVKNGVFTAKYLDGQIEKIGLINNDNNVGEWKYYYPNGQLRSVGSFKNDLPDGLWKSFLPDGTLKSKGEYKYGLQNGLWIKYDENGNPKYQVYYQYGKIANTVCYI